MGDLAHAPVLIEEVVEALNIQGGGVYLDATFGRGGHSRAILDRLDPNGRLLAIDRDPEAVAYGARALGDDARFQLRHTSFEHVDEFLGQATGSDVAVLDGAVVDLGVSSPQLDDPGRGFSFLGDGPLDMRMDSASEPDAATWLAHVKEAELARAIRDYGEDRFARRIARAIVAARAQSPITTTSRLAAIVSAAVPRRELHKHPATRTFQAVRVVVNDELPQLRALLPRLLRLLKVGGRLVVISFHSLEDRIVKRFFRDQARGDQLPPELPVTAAALRPKLKILGKAVHPSADEIERNPRARSAVMRVAERMEVADA